MHATVTVLHEPHRSLSVMPPEGRAQQIQRDIHEVLMDHWDPIGVRGIPHAANEYQRFVVEIHRLLVDKASARRIAEHLWNIEVKEMELHPTVGGIERLELVARELLHVDISRTAEDLSGMTVNERLYAMRLLEAFDAAVKRRDKETLIALLMRTFLSRGEAEESVDAILRDPAKYGYPSI